jgi:hypothetical protein
LLRRHRTKKTSLTASFAKTIDSDVRWSAEETPRATTHGAMGA